MLYIYIYIYIYKCYAMGRERDIDQDVILLKDSQTGSWWCLVTRDYVSNTWPCTLHTRTLTYEHIPEFYESTNTDTRTHTRTHARTHVLTCGFISCGTYVTRIVSFNEEPK